jgi:hypothetical protein
VAGLFAASKVAASTFVRIWCLIHPGEFDLDPREFDIYLTGLVSRRASECRHSFAVKSSFTLEQPENVLKGGLGMPAFSTFEIRRVLLAGQFQF